MCHILISMRNNKMITCYWITGCLTKLLLKIECNFKIIRNFFLNVLVKCFSIYSLLGFSAIFPDRFYAVVKPFNCNEWCIFLKFRENCWQQSHLVTSIPIHCKCIVNSFFPSYHMPARNRNVQICKKSWFKQ
jgi:hypothetical protein